MAPDRRRKFIALGTYSDSLFPSRPVSGFQALKKQLIYGDSMVNSQNREHRTALPFRSHPLDLRRRLLGASLVGSGLPEGWQGIKLSPDQTQPPA